MSKDNLALATRIIEQHGNVTKDDQGQYWAANLETVIGMSLGYPTHTHVDDPEKEKPKPIKKDEAIAKMAEQLAAELDSGALSLSDDWAESNLKK